MNQEALQTTELRSKTSLETILFFDGTCGLCNWTVNFVLNRDKHRRFLFSPLQGETAATYLGEVEIAAMQSVVLFTGGRSFRKSSAIVRLLWKLNLFWKCCGVLLWLVPKPLRDWTYKLIAKNRYRWFGQREACRVPTPAEREQFLD